MLATVEKVKELLTRTDGLVLAGDESLLRSLPRGNWIGGTIPYFMTAEGGTESNDRIFVVEPPPFSIGARIQTYDRRTIAGIGQDSPDNGYTILILPGFSELHRQFALEAPRYEQQFMRIVAGWIAGTSLDALGSVKPKVFAGPAGEVLDDRGVAIHVELPLTYEAKIGIVNIFEPGDGPSIEFLHSGFEASECLVDGKRTSVIDLLEVVKWDLRLPLIADFCGTKINVSIQAVDIPQRSLKFFAPVFEGVHYRAAKPIDDYAERFGSAVRSGAGQSVFACNCVLNYVHGQLKGRRTGALLGPMTFGEIAYQLLNQTLVHISVTERR